MLEIQRNTYKKRTLKTQETCSSTSLKFGAGFDEMLKTIARLISKFFGVSYVLTSSWSHKRYERLER